METDNFKKFLKKNSGLIIALIFIAIISAFYFYFKEEPESEPVLEKKPLELANLLDWQKADNIPWSRRDSHFTVVFDNKLWLMGGIEVETEFNDNYSDYPHKSDIWVSENGKDWKLVDDNAPWGKRRSLVLIDFKDKLWLIGGWRQDDFNKWGSAKNDIWVSENGADWERAVYYAQWRPREGHTIVVFDNKLWLIGGVSFETRQVMNDVWYSEDGINWIQATANADWSPRYDHTTVVFNNKIWLFGGVAFNKDSSNDIWVSENGKDWELVTENAVWPIRHGHTSLVYKDKIWIMSGWDTVQDKGLEDVWYSEDGYNWHKTEKEIPWIGREDHCALVYKDKIWLSGGMDTNWHWNNDVWYSFFTSP